MGRSFFVKPRRSSVFGVPPSIIHRVIVPSAFFTSTWIHEWGLISSTFATVPRNLIGCLASNSAVNAWCAHTGIVAESKPTPATRTASLLRIGFSPLIEIISILFQPLRQPFSLPLELQPERLPFRNCPRGTRTRIVDRVSESRESPRSTVL